MPSLEAVECLTSGADAWAEYRAGRSGAVDLSFCDLRGRDLRRRQLVDCDFTGARLDYADLDGAALVGCTFAAATLADASLVGCHLERTTFTDCELGGAVLRGCTMADVEVRASTADGARIEGCRVERSTFTAVRLAGASLTDLELAGCVASGGRSPGLRLTDLRINGSRIHDISLPDSTITRLHAHDSTIRRLLIGGHLTDCLFVDSTVEAIDCGSAVVAGLDLSRSTIRRCHVGELGPRSAVLLDTSLIECTWPQQRGKVTWTGRHIPAPLLLHHPVQDVKGLPPVLRREIADEQFLEFKLTSARSRPARLMLRLWGLAAGYGQSLSRLTVCSAIVVLLHAAAVLAVREARSGDAPTARLAWEVLVDVLLAFLGIGRAPLADAGPAQRALLASVRIAGFIGLGVWVGIAAQRLGRLSRE
ncbi:pentapeptide repeat-containing protein [Frankia sp. QA3]|uniref:pentapeptide repeat-containing protein n=1 Tax=Frankia sp. QA3 TaxID=710111 RepID=UPI000269CCF6|nr:pentapeptide repeat-containing protein [Frankia sp. QA3]EIV95609.1 putative low-complexity protein [Frankia sp. QA3]